MSHTDIEPPTAEVPRSNAPLAATSLPPLAGHNQRASCRDKDARQPLTETRAHYEALSAQAARGECGACNGSGMAYDYYDRQMEGWSYEPCAQCGGKGSIPSHAERAAA